MSSTGSTQPAAALPGAVLFDLDGTLVDTEPSWIAAEHRLVASYGNGRWTDQLAHGMIGFDLRDSARYLQRHGGVRLSVDDIVTRLIDEVVAAVRRETPWRPGALRLLSELRAAQVPCALVTMSWRPLAYAVVDRLPPGTFAAVITGDTVEHGKPHPEPYLTAARALWLEPGECVAIEDSPTGVASAMAAGCRTVAVPNMVPVEPRPGLTVVESLTKVTLPYLDSLFVPGAATSAEIRRVPPTSTSPGRRIDRPAVTIGGRSFSRRQLLIGAAAATGVVALGRVILGDEQPPPPPDIPIAAWVPYWQLDAATSSLRANSRMLTAVSPFWFEINPAGGHTIVATNARANAGKAEAFIKLARSRRLQVIPSIVDQTPAGTMAAVLTDPASRAAHVEAIAGFASEGRYDGIDIDYERFAFNDGRGTWATTRPVFSAFIAQLATRLHRDGRRLTVAVPTIEGDGGSNDPGYWVYDYRELAKHADQIRIMAYDKSYDMPGPVAPLSWVREAVRAAKRVSGQPSKLSLGIPLYGYSWVTNLTGSCPDGTSTGRVAITQRGLGDLTRRRDATPVHDDDVGESTFSYTAGFPDDKPTCHQQREVHIVTAAGARARIDLARKERLGGVSLWALGFDGGELWDEVHDLARQAASSVPPSTP